MVRIVLAFEVPDAVNEGTNGFELASDVRGHRSVGGTVVSQHADPEIPRRRLRAQTNGRAHQHGREQGPHTQSIGRPAHRCTSERHSYRKPGAAAGNPRGCAHGRGRRESIGG